MIKPKGLGRGLDALLGADSDGAAPASRSQSLPIDRLQAGQLPAAHADGRRRRSTSSPLRSTRRA